MGAANGVEELVPARLELENVVAGYNGRNALEDISFQVAHGEQVAVVGPNGAGKSTLFKVLVGILPIRSGQVRIHGHALGLHQDCVAYVPQREEVDWRFPVTVLDVVMMGRYGKTGWLGRTSKHDRDVAFRSLEHMGIAHLAQHPIGNLSGGQQQRVFLARALSQEPHILLMDEPFTGVDVSTQEATLHLLHQLRQQNVTVLVSTHDLNMAAQRFEKVLLLNRRVVAFGSSEQVFQPENLRQAFTGQFLYLEGQEKAVVVDQCCSDAEQHDHEHYHDGMHHHHHHEHSDPENPHD